MLILIWYFHLYCFIQLLNCSVWPVSELNKIIMKMIQHCWINNVCTLEWTRQCKCLLTFEFLMSLSFIRAQGGEAKSQIWRHINMSVISVSFHNSHPPDPSHEPLKWFIPNHDAVSWNPLWRSLLFRRKLN